MRACSSSVPRCSLAATSAPRPHEVSRRITTCSSPMLVRYGPSQRLGLEGLRGLVEANRSEDGRRVLVRVAGPQPKSCPSRGRRDRATHGLVSTIRSLSGRSRRRSPARRRRRRGDRQHRRREASSRTGRTPCPRHDQLLSHFHARTVEVGALLALSPRWAATLRSRTWPSLPFERWNRPRPPSCRRAASPHEWPRKERGSAGGPAR